MDYISIAIDGPSGAGKSTIARAIAQRLSYIYIDTGALYRAIGLYVSRQGVDTTDMERIIPMLGQIELALRFLDGAQHVYLNGEDVSEAIRLQEVSMYASNVSVIPEVRKFLLDMQRDFAVANNVIMDGRDIGTAILPNAQVKIYLTAKPEARAKRRYDELVSKGGNPDFDALLQEIIQRDYNDSHRDASPLKQAANAVLVDTTDENLDEAIAHVLRVIEAGLA